MILRKQHFSGTAGLMKKLAETIVSDSSENMCQGKFDIHKLRNLRGKSFIFDFLSFQLLKQRY